MRLFSKLFGKKSNAVYFSKQDELINEATKNAQQNFKFFWRELYWEYRRIVSGHDFAMIKIPFKQTINEQIEPLVEHMWINNIDFNGEFITGELVNEPNQLTNVAKGDFVSKKISQISDWMISIQGKTYGGYTIQVMRSRMSAKERKKHDKAWGLDFGNHNDVLLVHEQTKNPENLVEHPMSKNMAEKMRQFLKENPNEISITDKNGCTLLHNEAIAGNRTTIEILLDFGADKTKKSKFNKTALEYAELMNWEHLKELLN